MVRSLAASHPKFIQPATATPNMETDPMSQPCLYSPPLPQPSARKHVRPSPLGFGLRQGAALAALVGAAALVAPAAWSQTLKLSFPFADAPGVSTTDVIASAVCNMSNYSKALADLHGANGSGPGKFGYSLDFTTATGANSANSVTSSSSTGSVSDWADTRINLGSLSSFTASFWLKTATTLGSGYSPTLFVLAPGSNARSTLLQNGANTLGFTINTSGNPQFWAGSTTIAHPVASSTLAANTWYFYALAYDGASYKVYVGTESTPAVCVSTNSTASQTLAFGSSGTLVFGDRASDNTRNFPGWLAQFRLYSGGGAQSFVESVRQSALPLTAGPTVFSPASPVYVGTPVTMSAGVSNGVTPYTYDWQLSADDGVTFSSLSSGNGSASCNLNTAGMGGKTNYYRLVVTDSSSPAVKVTNSASALFISSTLLPPVVTADTTIMPNPVLLGASATMAATYSGTSLSYQWQYSTTNDGTAVVNLAGATNATYVLTNASFTNAGYYRLSAFNSVGASNSSFVGLAVKTPVRLTQQGSADVPPVPGVLQSGAYTISQLSAVGDNKKPNGLNYYDDNSAKPGQSFTTGANAAGYALGDLYYLCGGPSISDGAHTAGLVYTLRIYSMTNPWAGTATLISTYTNQNTVPAIANNVWAHWTGLTNVLAPNSVYAYSIGAGSGWMHMGNASNSPAPYTGGQLALFPTATGAATFGSGLTSNSSAAFMLNLVPAGYPALEAVSMSVTNGATVVAGTPVALSATAAGDGIGYVWQCDGASGGSTFTNLTNPNSYQYTLDTSAMALGAYQVRVLVTNSLDTNTSAALSFSIVPAIINSVSLAPGNADTNPVYAGTPVILSASVEGRNLTYYWRTDNGSGGNMSLIPNSNTNVFALSTSTLGAGTYLYDLLVSNASGTVTSTQLSLYLSSASGPILIAGAKASPVVVIAGGSAQLTASFKGSQPIAYQWQHAGTNLPGATGTNLVLSAAQLSDAGAYILVASNNPPGVGPSIASSAAAYLYVVPAPQTNLATAGIFDSGTQPYVGSDDLSQTTDSATGPETVNYYVDASNPPGQIFTTGSARHPLNYLYIKHDAEGGGAGQNTAQAYTLRIYQMLDATNAQLLTTYVTTNALAFASGDWLRVSGLTNILEPATRYAFSLARNSSGYWRVACSVSLDPDANGMAVTVPVLGGTVALSSPDANGIYYNAAYVVGLTPPSAPTELVATSITPSTVYAGQGPVTMKASFAGLEPITYQWQHEGTNLPGATSSTYVIPVAALGHAGSYVCLASNSVSSPNTVSSTAQTLTVQTPPATFTMNFSHPSYGGNGVLGSGTTWNRIVDGGATTVSGTSVTMEKNTAMLADDGSAMPIQFTTYETWEFGGGGGTIPLLNNWMLLQGQTAATQFPVTFSNCIPGVYNVVLYGNNGTYGSGRPVFTFGGITRTNFNTGNNTAFVEGDNYTLFTNLVVTNTLAGSWSQTGTGAEAAFNGAQLQMAYSFVNPQVFIVFQPVSTNVPVGFSARISVLAEGPGADGLPGPLSYQWFDSSTQPVAGATNSFYSPDTSVPFTGTYYVEITSASGLKATSSSATITVYQPDTLAWRGNDSSSPGVWDLGTLNWSNAVSQSDGVAFQNNNVAWFDDAATAFTVNVGAAVAPSRVVVSNVVNPYVFAGSSAIAGLGSLVKNGNGVLTISNNNTYSGGTVVNQGSLVLAKGGAAGTIAGSLAINSSGTVSLTAADALGYSGSFVTNIGIYGGILDNATAGNEGYGTAFVLRGGTVRATGGGAFNFGGGSISTLATNTVSTISAKVAMRADGLVIATAQGTVSSNVDLFVSGPITDAGGKTLTKSGNGILSLAGTNTFNGDLTIAAGKLRLDGFGVLNSGNFTAQLYNNGAEFIFNSSASQTLGGIISGSGALTINGNGTLALNGINTYTNRTAVNAGTLAGTGTIAGAVAVNSGATLAPGAGGIGTLTLSGPVSFAAGSTNVFEVNGSSATSDAVALGGTLSYGGTLRIVPSGTFTGGQQFVLFKGAGATNAGNFSTLAGSPGSGLAFSFTNGVLSVLSTGPSGPGRLTNTLSGASLNLTWPVGQGWRLQAQTNASGLGTNWVTVSGAVDGSYTIQTDKKQPSVFFRLVYP
jgi:autotransporter-associated beta strand protein